MTSSSSRRSIKPKATWALIKPHTLPLIQQFVFPLVCLTDDEIEQFTEDPAEFARIHFGGASRCGAVLARDNVADPDLSRCSDFIQDSYSNPCSTALSFVSTLVELRTAHSLKPILNFIQDVASK